VVITTPQNLSAGNCSELLLYFCSNIVAIVEIAFALAVAVSTSRGLCLEPQVSKKIGSRGLFVATLDINNC